ncbi:hypothetical protein JXL21_14330 [Candidatus Bathyarchaeota archaeon]|nr:hypothetical protein [Candidatus Bathyarchaeota archaeon]
MCGGTVYGFDQARRGSPKYLLSAVDETFALIRRMSGPGSLVVFDYVHSSVIDRQGRYLGEKEISRNVADVGEPWTFGFDEGTVEAYLAGKGFRLVEECSSEELERRYFTDIDGLKVGRINGTHSLVLAEVG